jgi:Sec-independent protein translocase protein TatA
MVQALIFDSVGAGEWFVLLAVVLIVVGPKRLPSTVRQFGQYYAKFRRAAESFKRQLLDMDTEFTRAAEAAERGISEVVKTDDGFSDAAKTDDSDMVKTDDGVDIPKEP